MVKVCCVRSCRLEGYPGCRKSFFKFPKDASVRKKWLKALGQEDWQPKDYSVVCSDHFNSCDFNVSISGKGKLKEGAMPRSKPVIENFQDPTVLKDGECIEHPGALLACRICLVMDCQLYDLQDYQLGDAYCKITGITWDEKDKLPQKICWECTSRLVSSYRLFKKALKSHQLLVAVLNTEKFLTVTDVKNLKRSYYELNSDLCLRLREANDCDLYIHEDSGGYDDIHNSYNDTVTQIEEQEVAPLKEETKCNDLTTEELPQLITSVEVKQEETAEQFYDEYLDDEYFNDSDDNLVLSEVAEKTENVRQVETLRKVKVKRKVKKKKLKVNIEKKIKVKRSKDNENPTSTMDKYKTSDVKRRRTSDGLDESLFIITSLSYEEQIAEIQKRQETTAYKNAPFKCTVCYRGFQIKERYTTHVLRHNDLSGAYECFICKSRLKTGRALRKHLTAQHTEKFSCKGCPFVTRNRGVAREHEKWHAGAKYQCPHCSSEFDKLTTYMGHIRIKHVSDFVCELCGFTFVSKKGIEVHKKKKHRLFDKSATLEGPHCNLCGVTFISEEAHSRHLKLSSKHSSDNDPNRIRNDSQSASTGGNGRVMRRIERRPVVHPRDPAALERAHRADRGGPVPCEQCGLQLRDLRLYAQHFRRAHPDKNRTKYPAMKTPCMCEQCGRIFQSMALLKDHMWVHTGEKRFKCSTCDKSFTQKTNLVFHMRVHSATRPTYECPLCGKHFAFFNNRRRHMFIHTGLKPFKCETCGKSFTTAGEQRAHVEHVHLKKPWPKRARGQRTREMDNDWHKCAMQGMED
ncbi:hypothetical protein ACJJTC_011298 [Scirpophaga incertulas]